MDTLVAKNTPARDVIKKGIKITKTGKAVNTAKSKTQKKENQHINLETKHGEYIAEIKEKYNGMLSSLKDRLDAAPGDLAIREEYNNVKNQYKTAVNDYYKKATPYLVDYYSLATNNKLSNASESSVDTHFIDVSSLQRSAVTKTQVSVLDAYLLCFDRNYVSSKTDEHASLCKFCGSNLNQSSSDGEVLCIICGYTKDSVLEGIKMTYRDIHARQTTDNYSYSKCSHLDYHLQKLQGKPVTLVPGLLDKLRTMIEGEGVKYKHLSIKKLRVYLQAIKMTEYYEDANYIIECLGGPPAPKLDKDTVELVKSMFIRILVPFRNMRKELFLYTQNKDRRNLVIYNFILYKIFEMIGRKDILKHICLMKIEKIIVPLEHFWFKTCKDCNFEYVK
jgi:hypothetical protein